MNGRFTRAGEDISCATIFRNTEDHTKEHYMKMLEFQGFNKGLEFIKVQIVEI